MLNKHIELDDHMCSNPYENQCDECEHLSWKLGIATKGLKNLSTLLFDKDILDSERFENEFRNLCGEFDIEIDTSLISNFEIRKIPHLANYREKKVEGGKI